MIQVILYSRRDCHLCDQAEAYLAALQDEFPHQLAVVDIDNSPALQRQYGLDIPVVEIGPLTLKAPISLAELTKALASASLGEAAKAGARGVATPQPVAGQAQSQRVYQTSSTWTRSDDITYWLSKHYLAILNLVVALYVGLPFLAPVLMKAGYEKPAAIIYKVYGATCHQLAYRSFFLFGEQVVYPRQAAGMEGLLSFQQASGIPEGSDNTAIFAARNFVGNPVMGYKVALCERDIALYGSILLFGIVFALSRRRIPALPWYLWLLFGVLPIAIDGLSQLFSQLPMSFIPYRESTPYLRVLTGFLFGFTTAWFGYPTIEQSMRDTQEMMETKRLKTQAVSSKQQIRD
jgi:uncharacterized membrane protein